MLKIHDYGAAHGLHVLVERKRSNGAVAAGKKRAFEKQPMRNFSCQYLKFESTTALVPRKGRVALFGSEGGENSSLWSTKRKDTQSALLWSSITEAPSYNSS